MFGKRNAASPGIERAIVQGVSYELTLAERMRRSERRAWTVASCAVAMSLLLAGGYFLFLPLKERVPYLVMADPYTGTATVARLVGDFHDRDVTAEEAINKSNVARFVLSRETYDSGLVGQQNWRTTLAMADSGVAPAYIALHSESNLERPNRIYGTARAVRVRILSIVLIGGGAGRRPTGATVRFQRSIYDKGRGRAEPLDSKIATLEFRYDRDLRLAEEDRLLNPLGFRVTNYRVDNDYAPLPAPEPDLPAPAPESAVSAAAFPPAPPVPDAAALASSQAADAMPAAAQPGTTAE